MKLWIHLTDLLNHIKTEDDKPVQVVDIQISISKMPKHLIIYKINELQVQIDSIREQIAAGNYGPAQLWSKNKELQKMFEKQDRLKERYQELIDEELKKAQNPSLIPKLLMIHEIETVFVTLKSNKELPMIHQMFERENNASKLIRKVCCV